MQSSPREDSAQYSSASLDPFDMKENGEHMLKEENKADRECRVDVKKAQEEVGICKEVTQRTSTNVTSMDCQLGNPSKGRGAYNGRAPMDFTGLS
ncbi:hypothetical protein Tco_0257586 [Tanacetum coccineum]